MFRKIIVSLIFIVSIISAKAQDKDKLIGEWIFKEVYNQGSISPESLAQVNTKLVNKMKIEFIDEENYRAYVLGEDVEGKWNTLKKIEVVVIQTPDGPFRMEILKLTNSEMAIRFALGEFLMVRR